MQHNLRRFQDVQICAECGVALHLSGYWYLAGYKSKNEPPCSPHKVDEQWRSMAKFSAYPGEDSIKPPRTSEL